MTSINNRKFKHTAKNWQAKFDLICTEEEDYQTIARVCDDRNRKWRSTDETEANAQLIANTPSLLKALIKLLDRIEDISPMEFSDYSSCSDKKIAEIENAYDAIIKATDVDIRLTKSH